MRKLIWVLAVVVAASVAACASSDGTTGGVSSQPDAPTTAGSAPTQAVPPTESAAAGTSFQILPGESEARFTIGEVLMGQDNSVVGATSQVEGGFSVDLNDPASATFQPVVIDATTFKTDEDRRNQAIQRFILETGSADNKTVTFQPTAVQGLPSTAQEGSEVPVSIQGDLTIHGQTQPVTFDGTVTLVSPERIEGSLSTTINRGDYGLSIPSVRIVASVDEQLKLEFDFAAAAS
jgi:polyisoprenoid-binding protein YceI